MTEGCNHKMDPAGSVRERYLAVSVFLRERRSHVETESLPEAELVVSAASGHLEVLQPTQPVSPGSSGELIQLATDSTLLLPDSTKHDINNLTHAHLTFY